MNFVDSLITLFLLTLLYLSAVKCAHIPKEGWRISHDGAPGYNVFVLQCRRYQALWAERGRERRESVQKHTRATV
ncbi:hypothetical protein J4Q44_G00320660 [Coregonus suidteri]|uniref:Secreted protein n=1 Tax=Coregonus suidteri TaxID=861788 RepID=A0AAN8QHZ8_9TELE